MLIFKKRKRTNLSIWNKLLVVYAIVIGWFSWKFEWSFSNWHNKSKVRHIKIYGTCIYLKHSYWKSRIAQLSNKNEQLLYQSSLEKFLTRNLVVIDLRFFTLKLIILAFHLDDVKVLNKCWIRMIVRKIREGCKYGERRQRSAEKRNKSLLFRWILALYRMR